MKTGILFFNGWGMDEAAIAELSIPEGYEVYALSYPYDVCVEPNRCDAWIAIGWSFGAYYMTRFLQEHPEWPFTRIIGLNGHGQTIGSYGIAPKMFQLTLRTLTPDSLLQFYDNMGLPEIARPQKREFTAIYDELAVFGERYEPLPSVFTELVVGLRDRIIPGKKQVAFAEQVGVPVRVYSDMDHYPFRVLDSWQAVLGEDV